MPWSRIQSNGKQKKITVLLLLLLKKKLLLTLIIINNVSGKVILHTTAGDVEIELWCKETPKAARNFIQLCMEGYYDNTIFHRIVPNFIMQGGDPSGTGQGTVKFSVCKKMKESQCANVTLTIKKIKIKK